MLSFVWSDSSTSSLKDKISLVVNGNMVTFVYSEPTTIFKVHGEHSATTYEEL